MGDVTQYENCIAFDFDKLMFLLNKDVTNRNEQYEKSKLTKTAAKNALEELLAEQQKQLEKFMEQYQSGTIPDKIFVPELTKLPVFGDKQIAPDLEFPRQKDLDTFPLDKRIKLQKISFQTAALHKIKFHFTSDVESPLYECATPCNGLKSKTIETDRPLKKVMCRIQKSTNFIFGIKIMDDKGAEVVNLFDSGSGYGEWQQ